MQISPNEETSEETASGLSCLCDQDVRSLPVMRAPFRLFLPFLDARLRSTMQIAFTLSTLQVCETNTTTIKDLRLNWTEGDEAEDYVVPNVLSPRDLVFRPDLMDETVTSSSDYFHVGPLDART